MKKYFLPLCALPFLGLSATPCPKDSLTCEVVGQKSEANHDTTRTSVRDSIIKFAESHLKKPYRIGGKGPKGFDCSGFTSYVFKKFGYSLGASAAGQYNEVNHIPKDEIEVGDLLFFKGRNSSEKRVGHVGIAYEIDKEQGSVTFIHAAVSGGVRLDKYPESNYYKIRYIGAGRVIKEDLEEQSPRITHWANDTIATKHEENQCLPSDSAESVVEENQNLYHTVKQGETLYSIAKKYDLSVEEIKTTNNLKNNNLKIGKILTIKKGKD